MGESASDVSGKGVSEQADRWAAEIRDYLLGRLSKTMVIGTIPPLPPDELTHPPIRRWWIFEGKRYPSLGGSIASNWISIVRQAQRLEQTFNPRLRLSDRAEGTVDWARTLARGPLRLQSEFVIHSSGIGLNDEERAALHGWTTWISNEWYEYTGGRDSGQRLEWRGFEIDMEKVVGVDRLRRWAHTAKRSRWPLLRDVVAESLRPVLEPSELDRIPLPAEDATLFELVCLVRIACHFDPVPRDLNWLANEITGNQIRLNGVRAFYQQSMTRETVLASTEYRGSIAAAFNIFNIQPHKIIDLAFDFDKPRDGFDGIIVEAKSGAQQYEVAVPQLRDYRAARPRRPQSRYLVWGVIEKPEGRDTTCDQVRKALAAAGPTEDVWLFSSADAIPHILETIFGVTKSSDTVHASFGLPMPISAYS
jgi:hypothetical protein